MYLVIYVEKKCKNKFKRQNSFILKSNDWDLSVKRNIIKIKYKNRWILNGAEEKYEEVVFYCTQSKATTIGFRKKLLYPSITIRMSVAYFIFFFQPK